MRARSRATVCSALAFALGAALAPAASAAVTAYWNRAAFEAAIAALPPLAALDFEDFTAPAVLPSEVVYDSAYAGFSFRYEIEGAELLVTGAWATTSGANSLGTTGDDSLLASDAFTLEFAAATAIGLYVIGEDMQPGDVELQTDAGVVANEAAESTLADGSSVFFLGLVESDPALAFREATLVSRIAETVGDYVWNVDDIVTAPAPDGAACGLLALAALAGFSRRRAAGLRRARSASRRDR
jgi:hypothetical protein